MSDETTTNPTEPTTESAKPEELSQEQTDYVRKALEGALIHQGRAIVQGIATGVQEKYIAKVKAMKTQRLTPFDTGYLEALKDIHFSLITFIGEQEAAIQIGTEQQVEGPEATE